MKVRYADKRDFTWLTEIDHHVSSAWVSRCLVNNEYLICERQSVRAGFLRHSLFWGEIPYMDMIFVLEHQRCVGVGTALFAFWERMMKTSGAKILMTSSETEEKDAQEWHRRNGFEESGQLTFGQFQPSRETFFIKNLQTQDGQLLRI